MSDYYLEDGSVITEEEAYEIYDESMDGEGTVTVAGIEFDPSAILKELDPIAYRCGFNDYESLMIENGEWFEEDPTEDEDDTDWEQYWEDYDNGKIKAEDRKDDLFRN